MLTQKQIQKVRTELQTAQNPLFLFDNDADGLASFLLLYRFCKEGKGVIFRSSKKNLSTDWMRTVNEYNPDKIFVLDIPEIDQDFIDQVKRPIIWIDHHPPQKRNNVQYYNPLIKSPNSYIPTTQLCYQITQDPKDLWLATAGTLADYKMPPFIDQFIKEYPQYLKRKTTLPKTIFQRPVGEIVKFLFFTLKGPSHDVKQALKVLSRIKQPDEIFKQTTSQGKYLHKRYNKINHRYQFLINDVKKHVTSSRLLLYYYTENQWSFTTNLANELAAKYPKKLVLIARKKGDEVKCSLRAQFNLPSILQRINKDLKARGGGHPNACGAVIHNDDWPEYLSRLKKELKKQPKDKP